MSGGPFLGLVARSPGPGHEDDEVVGKTTQVRRVQVTFTEAQWALIMSLRGIMGDSDATVVRSIVMAWLAEKSLLSTVAKERLTRWPRAALRQDDNGMDAFSQDRE